MIFKNQQSNKNPLVVYWAFGVDPDPLVNVEMSLLSIEPKSAMKDLLEDPNLILNTKKQTYRNCPAFVSSLKNYFILKSPVDLKWTFINHSDNQYAIEGENLSFFKHMREDTYSNRLSFDLKLDWIFFCEQPLVVKQTPPFSHHTMFSQYGTSPVGQLDIHSWFRVMSPSFMLWPNINTFTISKNEPLVYLHFNTDNKIIFKKFAMTDNLVRIARACGNNTSYLPNISLAERYRLFNQSKLRKIVLKEIQNNLLD